MALKEERIAVAQKEDIFTARKMGREMAAFLGFDDVSAGEIEITVSELATNLVKHRTIQGEIILRPLNDGRTGIEIKSEDKGPGIKDLNNVMKEGFSTTGSLGAGLPGVKRLMDEFSLESTMDKGTSVIARKWLEKEPSPMKFSVMARPKFGEDVSGDAYFIKRFSSYVLFGIADVLGHGQEAYEVAQKLLGILEDNYTEPLLKIVESCHKGLKDTRGAAMALCKIDFREKKLEHLSIGNVETRVYNAPQPVKPFSFNGTLGMIIERHRVIEYPYAEGEIIVMFSDGISHHFDLESHMFSKRAQEIAAHIFDNYAKTTDDATVLVGR